MLKCLNIRQLSHYAAPKFSRLKTLSKLLNITPKTIAEQIGFHQKGKNKNGGTRGKYLCCYDREWYEFETANEIIIPYHYAEKYAHGHKKKLHYLDFDHLPSVLSPASPTSETEDQTTENTQNRIPVIALLGHYNHGKTTLLDYFAQSNLVSKEAHGITQEIRTRYVSLKDGNGRNLGVTFVDTPGQEIFYRMRNYGAGVADMGLLLVAANDGIESQTQESIGALEDLKIPVIVCLNKIDHPQVLPRQGERITDLTKLLREFVVLEDAPIVPISALVGTNIKSLQAEILRMVSSLPNRQAKQTLNIEEQNLPPQVVKKNLPHYSGLGTVLNIWSSPTDGQMIHLIVRDGEIFPGSWFSAGGWAGNVVAVFSDDPLVSQGGNPATKGMGVKLRISAKVNLEPRPIGDNIYFFQDREHALQLADYRHMELTLEDHQIPRKMWKEYGIPAIAQQKQKNKKNKKGFQDFPEIELEDEEKAVETLSLQEAAEEDMEQDITMITGIDFKDNFTSGDDSNFVPTPRLSDGAAESGKVYYKGMEFIEEYDEYKDKELVVLKANSDLALCTFMDSMDEIKERLTEELEEEEEVEETTGVSDEPFGERDRVELEILSQAKSYDDVKLREVVRGGIGNVNVGDVMMARTAKGPVLAYEVGVNPDALKLAEAKGVSILYFNKMQDVVDILRGSDYEKYFQNRKPRPSSNIS